MHKTVRKFVEAEIYRGLGKCYARQVNLFRRMYYPKDMTVRISAVIQAIPDDKIENALDQVERTVSKNNG